VCWRTSQKSDPLASASREPARANPCKWNMGDGLHFRHGRAVLQPFSQHLYRFCFAAGQNLNAAVGAVDCITTEPQLISLLPCGFPEPDALDTPLYLEFPTFTHLAYTSNQQSLYLLTKPGSAMRLSIQRTINQTPVKMAAMPPSLDKSIGC